MISIGFIICYMFLIVVQLPVLIKLINTTTRDVNSSFIMYMALTWLAGFFFNDAIAMMLYYWGAPAYHMTAYSVDYKTQAFINEDTHCMSPFTESADLKDFLTYNLTIAQYTPVIWTVVFMVGYLFLQKEAQVEDKDAQELSSEQRVHLLQMTN